MVLPYINMNPPRVYTCSHMSFKPAFSLSSFTLIKRLFSFSSLSAMRVVSPEYLKLLIFISPANLYPSLWFIWCFVWGTLHMSLISRVTIYSLDVPFPILNQSIVPCPVLTVASWPAYRFLRRQIRWYGIPISWRTLQFVVIHIVKSFSIVSEADTFLEFPCFFYATPARPC